MPNVTIEYYGVNGTGRNVTEAKKDAGEQIRKALEGDYYPFLIRWRQYIVLVWREPKSGWGYRISHPESQGAEIREAMWLSSTNQDRDQVFRDLAHHIGDIGRRYDEDPELTRPLFDALLRNRDASREFEAFKDHMRRNYTFQARYRHAVDVLHLASNDAHNWAGMNPATYDSWKGTEQMFTTPSWEAA